MIRLFDILYLDGCGRQCIFLLYNLRWHAKPAIVSRKAPLLSYPPSLSLVTCKQTRILPSNTKDIYMSLSSSIHPRVTLAIVPKSLVYGGWQSSFRRCAFLSLARANSAPQIAQTAFDPWPDFWR